MTASILKNAIFNLSKSSPIGPSLPVRPKVSRVCFTSATKYPQGRNAAEDDGRREYSPYNSDEVRETLDKGKQMKENTAGKTKDKAREMNEYSKEKLGTVADKAYEMSMDTAGTVADKMKETVQGALGAAKETTHKIKETVVGNADDVEDHVKKKLMDEDPGEGRPK